MIIDGHAHLCKDEYGNVETLLEQYKIAKIDKGVLVPGGMLDVRKMTSYITNEAKPKGEYIPNDIVEEAIRKYPDKFYGFYCVNPHLGEKSLEDFEDAIKNRGFKGLKLAPMVHQFSLTSNIVMQLADLCGDLNVPFFSHVVYSPAANTKKFEKLVSEFKNTTFVLGHMGFGPADTYAISCAEKNPNMYLETSQGSYQVIKLALESLGSEKIIFGTEYPMYHPLSSIDNINVLDCTDKERENILCNNILRVLGEN